MPRRAREVHRGSDEGRVAPLLESVDEELQWVTHRGAGGWSGVLVDVERDDGMTWSAMAAERRVQAHTPSLPLHRLAPDRGSEGLPQIADLFTRARLIALAHECGLAPRPPALRLRWISFAAIALLALGALSGAVTAAVKANSGPATGLGVFLLGAAAAALLFGSQEAVLYLRKSARDEARAKALESIRKAVAEQDGDWRRLIAKLIEELLEAPCDRCVIIDDLDQLDETTAKVVRGYIRARTASAPEGRELWLLFDEADGGALGKSLLSSPPALGDAVRLRRLRQLNLKPREREVLVRRLRLPEERAEEERVKRILHADTETSPRLDRLLDELDRERAGSGRPYGPLELLHVLAVERATGATDLLPLDLLREIGGRPDAPAARVLKLALPGATFQGSELPDAFERLKQQVAWALHPVRLSAGRFDPLPEARVAIARRRAAFKLADPGVIHLFWAFYWFTKLGGQTDPDPYRLRKLGRHLVRATPPSALGDALDEEVSKRFVRAAAWAGAELLRASLPDDVPELIRVAQYEPAGSSERRALRRLCWQAYAVLGSEPILTTLLTLHPGRASKRAVTDLDRLFVDSVSLDDHSGKSRADLTERLRSMDPDVVGYARTRAFWLAITFRESLPLSWSRFTQIVAPPGQVVAALAKAAVDRLGEPGRSATDGLAASLAMWSYGLAYAWDDDATLADANDVLEDVWLRASALKDALADGDDFVLQALRQELEVMVSAAAVLVNTYVEAEHADPRELARLKQHLRPDSEITRQMSALELTWIQLGHSDQRPLGFEQLATFMTLRRVHFEVLRSAAPATEQVSMVGENLARQLPRPGVDGLLATLVAAAAAKEHHEIQARFLIPAAEAAVDSGAFGRDLETEFAMLTLQRANDYRTAHLGKVLDYLLAPSAQPGRSRVAVRLAEFSDRQKASASLWLANAALDDEVPESVFKRVVVELRTLAATCEEPSRTAIEREIHSLQVQYPLDQGKPVDIAWALSYWDERTKDADYAFMVSRLLFEEPDSPTLYTHGSDYLRAHPEAPDGSSPITLARKLAEHAAKHAPADLPWLVDFVARFHPDHETDLSAIENERILRLLLRQRTGDVARLEERLAFWAAAREQIDALDKLPRLIAEGKYFLLLWHYYERLATFGVETEPTLEYEQLIWMSHTHQDQTFLEWQTNGATVPPAIVGNGRRQLSGDFLRYGRVLFRMPIANDAKLDRVRADFNANANADLNEALELLIASPAIPENLRKLVEERRAGLSRA